jgi:LysR family transcriptional regulator of abg operon
MVIKQYQLRALVAIADSGSIRAAAAALCLSQPAITKAIRDLEGEIGLTLLVRSSRGVTLTPEGQVLLSRARMIGRELERVEEDIQLLKGQRGGRLQIGVTPLAGLTVMPKAFQRFRAAWPDIALSFLEVPVEQMYEALQDGRIDFAVGAVGPGRQPPHGSVALVSLPTSFAIRRGSPYAAARSLAELRHLEWLHSDGSERFPAMIAELFARRGLAAPARITRCTSQSLFYHLATQADVVIFWSRLSLAVPMLFDQFQAIALEEPLPDLTLHLMLREDGLLTRPAEYFIRCVREVAQEVP